LSVNIYIQNKNIIKKIYVIVLFLSSIYYNFGFIKQIAQIKHTAHIRSFKHPKHVYELNNWNLETFSTIFDYLYNLCVSAYTHTRTKKSWSEREREEAS